MLAKTRSVWNRKLVWLTEFPLILYERINLYRVSRIRKFRVISFPVDDDISIRYNWRNFNTKQSLWRYDFVSDSHYGGSSSGEMTFSEEHQCMRIAGLINKENREKLVYYPSIGISPCFDYNIQTSFFSGISIVLKSDGLPIQVQLRLLSSALGEVSCFGEIISKNCQFQRYELPIANMVVRGNENEHHNRDFKLNMSFSSMNMANDSLLNMRLLSEGDSKMAIGYTFAGFSIRLLGLPGNENQQREVFLRSIDLIQRGNFKKFKNYYRRPYFFIAPSEKECPYPSHSKITKLSMDYTDFKVLDHGDRQEYLKIK